MNLDIWYERDPQGTCVIKMKGANSSDDPFTFILVHNENKYKYNPHQRHTLLGIAELLGVPNIEERPWTTYDTSPSTNPMPTTDK